jgi:hypothetical protein
VERVDDVERYALRIVVESRLVNLADPILESVWLNFDSPCGIPASFTTVR